MANRRMPMISPDARKNARRLRRSMSMPERVLWSKLRRRQLGVRIRRQHPIGPFIADFYCSEAALVVEVDGRTHASRAERDAARDRWFEDHGVETLRISAAAISANLDGVLRLIHSRVQARLARVGDDAESNAQRNN